MAGYSAPALAGYDKGPVVFEGIKLLTYGGNNFATSVDTLKANFERAMTVIMLPGLMNTISQLN